MEIAVLLTCFNRIQKTDECLSSLLDAVKEVTDSHFSVYLVDDCSTDGTASLVTEKYPQVHYILGSGMLYWAGGMRLCWETVLQSGKSYDGFLLINDDVHFFSDFWDQIKSTIRYSKESFLKAGICVLSTKDKETGKFTYGGHRLIHRLFKHTFYPVEPTGTPQPCQLTNANILFVPKEVVDAIGILDRRFTHSLADFDYSLTAWEKGIPILVCPGYGGLCSNDHPEDSLSTSIPFVQRVKNLYGVKGIALHEYIYYLNKHFRLKAPYAYFILWLRAIFPSFIKA